MTPPSSTPIHLSQLVTVVIRLFAIQLALALIFKGRTFARRLVLFQERQDKARAIPVE
jgi:hypothetical protein